MTMKTLRRPIYALFIMILVLGLAGCAVFSPIKRKFTPKKKDEAPQPTIVTQFSEGKSESYIRMYQKHYVYWSTWQEELIDRLGDNNKKDKQCIDQIMGNLQDMQKSLVPEKSEALNSMIQELVPIKTLIYAGALSDRSEDKIRRILEKSLRAIRRDYYYKKVKQYIKPD